MSAIFGVWRRDAGAPAEFCGPSMSQLAHVQMAFDGRLDNRAEILEVLASHHDASARSSDAELVALMYARRGEAFVKHLQGDFALALHDAHARRLFLARDAIGIRPLYYAVTPRRIIFASRIQRILDDPATHARPNERLLSALMLQQLHRQDDDGSTFFEGISSIPAAHVVVCDVDRVHVTRYWEFEATGAGRSMSFDDCAAALRSHLTVAVERRLRSEHPVAISVSGGLDSSAIFCLARRSTAAASMPLAFTYTARDGSPADEHLFVEDLERLHGRIEYVETPNAGSVVACAREAVRRTEGPMLDVQGNRNTAFTSAVAGSGARVLMTGHWGDQVMFDQAYLVDTLRELSWATVRRHLDEYLRWFPDARGNEFTERLLSDVLDHAAPGWARPLARGVRRIWRRPQWWQRVYTPRFRNAAGREGFRRQPTGRHQTTALCSALYREARSKYHALCLEHNSKQSAQHGLAVTFPFLDRDLLGFLLGVPGQLLARDGVPKALLREAMRGIVPESIRTRRTKGDFTAIVTQAAQREFSHMLRLLSGEPLVVQFGYVDVETLIAGLRLAEQELAQSESCVAAWRLADIVALEVWLQEFFGSRQLEDVIHARTTRQEQDESCGARREEAVSRAEAHCVRRSAYHHKSQRRNDERRRRETTDQGMSSYGVYGVTIRSDWRLPYPKASRGEHLAEVTLRRGTAAQFAKAVGPQPLNCGSALRSTLRLTDGSTYLRWTNVLDFLIPRDGKTLLCRPLHEGAEAAFHTHLGPSLSFALLNLGIEPLHSTTFVVDGAAVALMGDCGYGKSTLGASFVNAGLPLLTDDLLVLSHDAHSVTAHAGAPRVKLYPAIARRIFGARVNGLRLKRFTDKLIIPLVGARAQLTPVPLKAIYVLTPPRRRSPACLRIRPMTPRQAFMDVIRNTFNGAVNEPARLERQFGLAARLCDGIPIKSLSYPREFSMLRAVRDAILRDLAA